MIPYVHISKVLSHPKCLLTAQLRNKKYYRKWWIPFHLDDFQNMSRSKPNAYEKWDQEWIDSRLPSELQYLDTSRLPIHLKARTQPSKEFFKVTSRREKTEDYRRRLFGEYGFQSGIDPAVLFMNDSEVTYEKNKESVLENSVLEVVDAKSEQDNKAREKNEALMLKIKKNLEKMPELLKKFYDQEAKQLSVDSVKVDKMKILMEEARDRFGYYPHKQDPKFVKLLEEFDERKKLERKQKKK
ncbi:Growth arrest and DNA damage-inducible proteins-interacting protein 1 [Schistosoma japonicum]|uniref:Large ribosomal subunit protein mL64 n=2 Tax=Schistosoma japonicum TaxID=6182 RepID=C1LGR2_SCHJA|nr:Growth arrest and DNA damage-inducible proteins-interacting protein 1 [Schistosoma japonicum]KAH8874669.1 Growth arrest and DNA damage-inducible proteins-interacting protein 1 [Schistosoma japonicum]KAH8874670.1 Growth arrest and DNA damage-inducible proteins-interacting protein 1 [Schistosoma japonicum]KAH8874671.1 Growth arrest and DNA damage-inducible proteins-interacting protein 1 [Schistosoma japonicum]KAH8874673.1 Growth arrest and DNA damage-inducible proteins-interacting protein 1 [S